MNTIAKFLFGGLLAGFFLFFLFIPVFQAQAAVGTPCDVNATCKVGDVAYSCSGGDPTTPAPALEGRCTGPCTTDAQCDSVVTGLGWGGSKCTGNPAVAGPPLIPAANGVCLELPRLGSRLADTPPAQTGEGLLDLVDTLTNWLFAAFVSLAIIFLILAGLQFVSSGGEATKVGEARQKLVWAAVGIIVALASKALVPVIRSMLGG